MPVRRETVPVPTPEQAVGTLRYAVLGSGSSSNAYIFEYPGTSIVIDNGFSCREFLRRTCAADMNPEAITCIFVTHVHNDHIRGVSTLSRRLKVPVALHRELSVTEWLPKGIYGRIPLIPGTPFRQGPFHVLPFASSHDAPCSMNYHIRAGDSTFTIITDTGKILPEMELLARRSNILFLEANYAESMLINGPYPEDIKRRILSDRGHLSNADAVNFLNSLASSGSELPELVYFCHLSDTNNSPEVLSEYVRLYLNPLINVRICRKGELCIPVDTPG